MDNNEHDKINKAIMDEGTRDAKNSAIGILIAIAAGAAVWFVVFWLAVIAAFNQ